MSIFKKIISSAAAGIFLASLPVSLNAFADTPESKGLAIVYVNDVHCAINADDDTFGYAELAAYEGKLRDEGYETLLVDAGDFSQGSSAGTLSEGGYLISIMNDLGFDYAVPGNHEFDYGISRLFELADAAKFKLLSSNFYDVKNDKYPFNGWDIYETGEGVKIGLVGVTSPETRSSSNPLNFRDENGEFIYDFCVDADGSALYKNVQGAVDAARAAGADYVIALAHLGIKPTSAAWRSTEVIANTTGIDVMLDGHSHSVISGDVVKNKDGKDVILTSTGTKLANIGTLFVGDGTFTSKLIAKADYTVTEDKTSGEYAAYTAGAKAVSDIESKYNDLVKTVVGKTDADLIAYNKEADYVWEVRVAETNLGDFCADAYKEMLGADVAVINGGGIRSDIAKGDITYNDILSVHPYGNSMCVAEVTGQEILDALEVGARLLPLPSGGFLQVSGITYEIHTYIESGVVLENEDFVRVDGEYRVKNVSINGEPLDPEKVYTLASHSFIIKSGGSGLSMFRDNKLIMDEGALDNQVLINYINDKLNGVIGEGYENKSGAGRITIFTEKPEEEDTSESEPEDDNSDSSEPEDLESSEPEDLESFSPDGSNELDYDGSSGTDVNVPDNTVTSVDKGKDPFKDEATGIEIIAGRDAVPAGAVLAVRIVEAEDEENMAAYDICLVKDGRIVQPNGKITLRIPVPEKLKNAEELFIYRAEAEGRYTPIKSDMKNGCLEITLDHLSVYVISSYKLGQSAPATGVYISIAPAVLAAAAVLVLRRKNK